MQFKDLQINAKNNSINPKNGQKISTESSELLLKFPYIKLDLSQKRENMKSKTTDKVSPSKSFEVNEKKITKFEKLLIRTIILKYDIILLENNQIVDIPEKKYEFLTQNKRFLNEIQQSFLSSKEFLEVNSNFLNSNTNENDKQFQFQNFLFCIEKLIKQFIQDYSKKNNNIFAFLRVGNVKSSTVLEPNSERRLNQYNEIKENENQQIIQNILKNRFFNQKETILIKKIFNRIHPFSMKTFFDVINTVDNYIGEKQSRKQL